MRKNIIILDPYKETDYRISKDTSGGYGTGNDFGDSIIPKLIKKKLKDSSDWPPLFAAYTHAVLSQNHETLYKKITSLNQLDEKIIEQTDIFIIVSSIVCCETEIRIIKELHQLKKITIAIGPFASTSSQIYTDAGASVVKGEPELYFFNENIKEIKLEPKILISNKNTDLNQLPYPLWNKIMDIQKIKIYGKYKSVPILATRGCPYSCFRYCVYPLQQGRVVRQRTPENIFNEIKYWNLEHNVKLFIFRDPVFSINKKHTIELCKIINDSNIEIDFVIETHLRLLDDNLVSVMKKAGLKYVKVGIENADTELLSSEKRFTVKKDEQLEKVNKLKNENINVSAMYILGFPSDNEKSVRATIDYARKLNTEYAQFSIWTPYPGTPAFKDYENIITTKNYENFDQYRLVYKHKNLSGEKLRDLLSLAYTKYYFRLSWIIKYSLKKINVLL